MIRILHLTDFHLDKKRLNDWNDYYKEAFFNKIDEVQKDKLIDIVLFTGDLIDKGGINFKATGDTVKPATKALNIFKTEIIDTILEKLNLDISRFIICPGNHDIDRNADDEVDENGIKTTLVTTEKVIEFIRSNDEKSSFKRIERIKEYKEFEIELYKNANFEKEQSVFKFSSKITVGDKTIGISSLNSSWRCYGDDDFQNILLGENQLNDNYKFIKDCDIKIALIHHQLDWLKDFEKKTINSHINKNYDLVLSGHVHESMSSMTTGFTGSCFHNVSPSGLNQIRTDSTTYSNGFTIIDFNDTVACHYLKYNHQQICFVDNTDIVPTGKKSYNKPAIDTENDNQLLAQAIRNIKDDHTIEMNNHFIKGKNEAKEVVVKEAFVFPPIDDGKNFYEQEQSTTTFNEIVNSDTHFLFLGAQETGKRSLLFRVIVEYIDEYEIYKKIPVFIDFIDIKNKEFITIIKEYTRLSSENVKQLLKQGKFVLLVDNLNFHESRNMGAQINKLHKFNKDFPSVRIIGTYEYDGIDILPNEIISHCKIPFAYHYIRGLKTREIKQIMKQWLPNGNELNDEERLEKLVNTFSSYHLPNNALSVHLYLWSVENSDRKPINQAVLMEIYIELILEKLNKENIYRSNFDFTNKVQLISVIAEKIISKEDDEFILTYIEFTTIIDDYIKNKVGFSFDVSIIIDYLLDRKIFVKNNSNEIKFSHLCFMHFFTAKRMQDNPEFKAFILDEIRYFNYPKEIDYYTGLTRSDKDTFEVIYKRFKNLFDPMDFILENVNPDEYFNIKVKPSDQDKEAKEEPIARNIEIAKVKDSRPSDEIIEQQYDEQLNKISTKTSEIKGNQSIDFDRMMLIMCNTLRNSEGVENLVLKKQAYDDIVKHNLTYSILYSQVLIRYILKHRKLPPSMPQNISLDKFLKNTPFHIQHALFTHLGTKKLSNVILDKINRDKNKSNNEIEKFLSIALYADVYGDNFDGHLRTFIKTVESVPVQNYLLFKLTDYLYRRAKPDSSNEELYLDLISDLKIRSQKLPKRLKDTIIKDLRETKNKMSKFIGLK